MQRRKVCIITRDPLLKLYLEQRLTECAEVELVNSTLLSDATVMEHRAYT